MGFYFDGDPNLQPEAEFETCPEGTYKISGIKRWMTTVDDSTPLPCYVFDDFQQDMVARMELTRADGGIGPAYSARPVDLVLLVKGFGIDLAKLPVQRNTSNFLAKVESLINASGQQVTATVNSRGWVSFITEATPPEGFYRWVVEKSFGDDPITFKPNEFSKKSGEEDPLRWTVFFRMSIAGDMFGNPTPFDGYQTFLRLNNPFEGVNKDLPVLHKSKNGAMSVSGRRMQRFATIYAPHVLEEGYTWKNPANPIDEILRAAVEGEKTAVGQFTWNTPRQGKPRLVLNVDSLTAIDSPVVTPTEVSAPPVEEEKVEAKIFVETGSFAKEHPQLALLVQWIEDHQKDAFKNTPIHEVEEITLSTKGKNWCDNNLAGAWEKAGLEPKAMPVREITEDMAEKLLAVLKAPVLTE